jgi:hypothetical protein
MINFFQTIARAPFAFAGTTCSPIASSSPADAAAREEAEYQTVYALVSALLAVGAVIVVTALAHAAAF